MGAMVWQGKRPATTVVQITQKSNEGVTALALG